MTGTDREAMSDEAGFVYGYGSTKHIEDMKVRGHHGNDWGLCGAPGGHPLQRPHLPTCKRCSKIMLSHTDDKGDR